MKTTQIIIGVFVFSILLFSCSKEPGAGGTSSIIGKLEGIDMGSGGPEYEVTTVTVPIPDGDPFLDDGDYWIINAASGNQYYIWYDNTNNPISTDPNISGRIGIDVPYSFSQSNSLIATNTAMRIQQVAGADFSVEVDNDVITITNNQVGQVPDADNMNSPLAIDVQNQGSGGSTAEVAGPIVDERVYLIYGDEDFYSDDIRTDDTGMYQFKGLRKGTYRVYALSKDTLTGNISRVETSVEISKNKTVVEASTIFVFQ